MKAKISIVSSALTGGLWGWKNLQISTTSGSYPPQPPLRAGGVTHIVNVGGFTNGQKQFLDFHRTSVLLRADPT